MIPHVGVSIQIWHANIVTKLDSEQDVDMLHGSHSHFGQDAEVKPIRSFSGGLHLGIFPKMAVGTMQHVNILVRV